MNIKIEVNPDDIKNETLAKLTWREIGELGLCNLGVFCYHGVLKSRRQGWKTEVVSDVQTNFISASGNERVEFIKIQQTDEDTNYAMRAYSIERDHYIVHHDVLAGCDFFKH